MLAKCPKSGITYTVSGGWGSCVIDHPIFSVSLRKLLIDHLPNFVSGSLHNSEEIHTLGCALVSKLPIRLWDCALPETDWSETWKLHIPTLAKLVSKLDPEQFPKLPQIVISKNSTHPDNLIGWMDAIETTLIDIQNNYITLEKLQKLARKEEVINRLISSKLPKTKLKLGELIAQWAFDVGEFPQCPAGPDMPGITLGMFWKKVIESAFSGSHIEMLTAGVTAEEIRDLIEHCEISIPHGSTHAALLMSNLRTAFQVISEFRPIEEEEIETSESLEPKILTEVPKPGLRPQRHTFATSLSFIQASLAWNRQTVEYKEWKLSTLTAEDI